MTGEWSKLAATASDDELRERILTGFKDGKPFTPYVPTLALPSPLERVLDFGCGLGRNFSYLKSISRHVTGFDLPEMIERCRVSAPDRIETLSSDWTALRDGRFDLIFASLVLQHMEETTCAAALDDFARIAPATYLITRGGGDFGFNVLDLVVRAGVFDADGCREVDHDVSTHQLRVLGQVPLDEAREPDDARHFELLLTSRAWRA